MLLEMTEPEGFFTLTLSYEYGTIVRLVPYGMVPYHTYLPYHSVWYTTIPYIPPCRCDTPDFSCHIQVLGPSLVVA